MPAILGLINAHISRDVLYTQANQAWKAVSGLATLLLIPVFLTQEEQGYWFTMMSLAMLVMLADLGFFTITLQFAAHEFAYLRFEGGTVTGDELRKKRLASLFVFCTKWALAVVCMAFPIILVIGFLFLSQKPSGLSWTWPWVLYVAGAGLTFFASAIIYFIEGCDSVGPMQKVRLWMAVVTVAVLWCGLTLGWGLYALSFSVLSGALFGLAVVAFSYGRLFLEFFAISKEFKYSWRPQFLGLLWRYALSWSSGYFIFQAYTPIMFHFHGPVEAGKVGLSIVLWMGVFSVANAWVYAVTPRLNMHVSQRRWQDLDALFKKNLTRSSLTFILGAVVVLVAMRLFQGRLSVIDRLVGFVPMAFLATAWFFQIVVNGMGVYLRSHKQEPLVLPSVVSAIYIAATTILCAKYLDARWFFAGWLSSSIWGIPWVLAIFSRRKRAWQT
jgi:hypothetical protein